MTFGNDAFNDGGIIHNSLFENSYDGKENYDHYNVMNAGNISSSDYMWKPKESTIDTPQLYSMLKA